MFINVRQDRDTGRWEWELHNSWYVRVDHGTAESQESAERNAEKARESYLYWLKYYRHREF